MPAEFEICSGINMKFINNPEKYNRWYLSQYGSWVGQLEFSLLSQLIPAVKNDSLLDVGCGSGYFTRKFADNGLNVTGIDPDPAMIDFANSQNSDIHYIIGNALELPFNKNEFDYSSAITSLCFIDQYQSALAEMWRVSKKGMILGLLNRNSLLFWQKADTGSYKGSRWDTHRDIKQWITQLNPKPESVSVKSVLFVPGMGLISQKIEPFISSKLLFGGFLAVYVKH